MRNAKAAQGRLDGIVEESRPFVRVEFRRNTISGNDMIEGSCYGSRLDAFSSPLPRFGVQRNRMQLGNRNVLDQDLMFTIAFVSDPFGLRPN